MRPVRHTRGTGAPFRLVWAHTPPAPPSQGQIRESGPDGKRPRGAPRGPGEHRSHDPMWDGQRAVRGSSPRHRQRRIATCARRGSGGVRLPHRSLRWLCRVLTSAVMKSVSLQGSRTPGFPGTRCEIWASHASPASGNPRQTGDGEQGTDRNRGMHSAKVGRDEAQVVVHAGKTAGTRFNSGRRMERCIRTATGAGMKGMPTPDPCTQG